MVGSVGVRWRKVGEEEARVVVELEGEEAEPEGVQGVGVVLEGWGFGVAEEVEDAEGLGFVEVALL